MNISDFLRQLLADPPPFQSPQTQITPRPQQSPPDLFSPTGAPLWVLEEASGASGFYAFLGRNGGSPIETVGWDIWWTNKPPTEKGYSCDRLRKFSFLDEALAAWDDLCAGTPIEDIKTKEYAV